MINMSQYVIFFKTGTHEQQYTTVLNCGKCRMHPF